jgi:HEAT repeat protein
MACRALPLLISLSLANGRASAAPTQADEKAILEAMADGSRPALEQAIEELRFLGKPKDLLVEIAEQALSGDLRARQNATYLFTVLPEAVFADATVRALKDEDPLVREQACLAAGKLKAKAAVPRLLALSREPALGVRREALRALGRIGGKGSFSALAASLDGPQLEIKVTGILALGELGDGRAIPKLVPLLEDLSESIRLAVARSLSLLGSVKGRRRVEDLLASPEKGKRLDGIRLMEEVKRAWVRKALFTLLRDTELEVRIASAQALGRQGDGRGAEWLVLAAQDSNSETRLALERALETLGVTTEERKRILVKSSPCLCALKPGEWELAVTRIASLASLPERIEMASARMLGTPYRLDPLGEGKGHPPDEDPRLRFDAFDCTTFVETVMALGSARSLEELQRMLDDIRYDGPIGYIQRDHFFEAQWLSANLRKGWVRDVTAQIGAGDAASWTKHVSGDDWERRIAARNIALPPERAPIGDFALSYLPLGKVAAHARAIPSGTLLAVVREDRPRVPLMITHLGFLFQTEKGPVVRHAGRDLYGRVADEELGHFLARNGKYRSWRVLGLMFLEVLDHRQEAG